ncbi:unnamed protein product [Amoebophrya sp. A120]|nr:unnamed protein product [Amoebophrya sp. A120]|eukprot:GSA120T00000370001.1
MIDSLFIISSTGSFVVEKHYKQTAPRSVCEPFLEYLETIRNNHRSPDKRKSFSKGSLATSGGNSINGRSPSKRRRRVNAKTESRIVGSLHQIPKIIRADNEKMALIHICRDRLVYLAVVTKEVPPLTVIEVLGGIHKVLCRYCFASSTEQTLTDDLLRQNFSSVYLLLDEMIDSSGAPFSLELNSLESIIDPPSTLKKVTQVVAGGKPNVVRNDTVDPKAQKSSSPDSSGYIADTWNTLSSTLGAALGQTPAKIGGPSDEVWWRKADAIYTTNEIYVDTVERADMILDENGLIIAGGIVGEMLATSKLSGAQPEVAISLKEPQVLENASFHPCVKLPKFDRDKVLQFVPPDGQFQLASYWRNDSNIKLPFHFRGSLVYHSDKGLLDIEVSPRLSITRQNKVAVEQFKIEIRVPESIAGVTFDDSMVGRFDEKGRLLVLEIGNLETKLHLKAVLRYSSNAQNQPDVPWEEKAVARIDYTVRGWVASGIRLDSLDVLSVSYTPYKACRYSSHGGRLEMRLFNS